jgi:hypothetical protein
MSDPAIKAALKAANAEAARRDAEDMDEDAVRRIIVAFLNAMPSGVLPGLRSSEGLQVWVWGRQWKIMAAAVEESSCDE